MGKPQEQTVAEKLRKQERTFLGTRRAEIEALASEGAEDLAAALRVAALQPCDAVTVVIVEDYGGTGKVAIEISVGREVPTAISRAAG
jgi:hypothetical protein